MPNTMELAMRRAGLVREDPRKPAPRKVRRLLKGTADARARRREEAEAKINRVLDQVFESWVDADGGVSK